MEVFKLDSWRLETTDGNMSARHGCYNKNGCYNKQGSITVPWVFIYPDDEAYCWRCEQRIPDGIIALYKMYKWGET